MGTAQQEIPVASTKVYIVLCCIPSDDYGYGGDTNICSVHRTREAACLVCQTRQLKQLEDQLQSVKADPGYRPELRYNWWVQEQTLED